MANTVVTDALKEEQWDREFFAEYVRGSFLNEYMGMSENDPIQIKNDLTTKAGNIINFPLVGKLSGPGVTGDNTLEGNEEALPTYGDAIQIDQLRNAVRVGKMEERSTGIDIRNAGRTMLKVFFWDAMRTLMLARMMSPHQDGVTLYADALEADKDAWLVDNDDRILFGAAVSNNSANDHSASLANIDGTADDFSPEILSLSKRRLKTAAPGIRPFMTKKGREWFLTLAGSLPFRDLKTNMSTIHQNAQVRGDDNPIFDDSDIVYDGNIVREVPEIPVISGVGAGAINVAAVFHLGAQAIGLAWGQKTKTYIKQDFDYGNQWGVSMSEIRGAKKIFFGASGAEVQHGMGTIYVSAVADT